MLPCGVSILSQFISNPAINRHHPSSLRVRSVQVRDYLNSSCPTSRLARSQSLRPLPGRLETRRRASIRPVSTVFLVRRLRSIGLTNKTSKPSAWASPETSCTSKLQHFDCRWIIRRGGSLLFGCSLFRSYGRSLNFPNRIFRFEAQRSSEVSHRGKPRRLSIVKIPFREVTP